jgi:hypothetical protein
MPSFANKVRGNQNLKSAARSLGMKPGQVKSRSDINKVRQEARSRASAATGSGSSSSGGTGLPTAIGKTSYTPATTGGSYVNSGLGTIGSLLDKYGRNETIAGMGVGTIFDIGRTQANTGLAIAYNDAFLGSLGNYQSGQENLRSANASKLMAQEGAIARDLMDLTTGRQLEGVRYGYDSQERQIGLTGQQERLNIGATGQQERMNMTQKGLEERKLRADARGAVRSQGARFYG